MSRIISYSTADKADVLGFLGAAGSLTADQQRILGMMRERAHKSQLELERQGIDWGLSIPDALEHLVAGHASSDAGYAAGAYYRALQHIIDCNASDPADLGVYSKPSTFFGLLDDELRRLDVRGDLLLHDHLFSGPPQEIPFHIPYPVDGPHIGMFPLAKAKPAADAYRAVLDRMDANFRHDVQEIIDKLDFENTEWEFATKNIDWYTQDTIFFSITG
ncbi:MULTISPECIES: hypothetical protein [unclassified Streptomyces]|uniref:DUF7691 family protein n=1 Tax=unclassified Streptomyces TaxID=2593676 RepID=UPI00236651B9|nr:MULTISPECIES: hypothetical protein [unclassified Streptomyces]MDF3144840.1 hypothetical protein [Streptomyces sp. T21Q-yed]WDF42262.1 hypothetical protein PBV52_38445 [Streptomyces sp. T12]